MPTIDRWTRARGPRRLLAVLGAAAALSAGNCGADRASHREASRASVLYNQGKYAEALPLLQAAQQSGETSGTLLYQIGFSRERVEGKADVRREMWKQAEPLLEKEVAAPGGATCERLYYLAVIDIELGEIEKMKVVAGRAVKEIEKGPDPNRISGEDWFRLARLHDFLSEPSEAEAAYRRAVSAFHKKSGDNPAYQALALARVGDLDRGNHHYDAAAAEYEEALKLLPGTDQVKPFLQGLVLLAIGRFDDAIACFGRDHDGDTATESQYAADLARKAKEVAPLDAKDRDGIPLASMPPETLQDRVREAAKDFRAAREKNSWKPGDTLTAEVAAFQKRFVGLVREHCLREEKLQDFCLREGIADLVRR
jgi:tetratricopeptide (TPR) repeat protein